MLKYCNDDEAIATHQSIIQKGIIIVRRMEVQQPPRPSENERQEESTDVIAAPAKKRRVVDILSTATSLQDAMRLSIDEHVREELSRYLG